MSVSAFLLWLVTIPILSQAVSSHKAYRLNCGGSSDVEQGDLKYVADGDFIRVGKDWIVKEPDLVPILSTLRFFPDESGRKYCYRFSVIKSAKYLVRGTFYYGGLDGGKEPPVFDFVVDGTICCTVNTTADYARGLSSYYEVVVQTRSKSLGVCLARNTQTHSSPFISALELQQLDGSLYNSTDFRKYALRTVARSSFGSDEEMISFPDDQYNRIWQPYHDNNPFVVSENNATPSGFWNIPPVKAFATAITASRGKALTIKWPPFTLPRAWYHIALYFQDNRKPSPYSWRIFSINVNGEKFYSDLNVTIGGASVFGTEWHLSGQTEIYMIPSHDMPVGPVINAGEIFQILPLGLRTQARDEVALEELAKSLKNPPSDWNGDPCAPKPIQWTGVTCTAGKGFRVTSLNLTGFKLSGSLPKGLDKLNSLTKLLLGDNLITGTIPDITALSKLEILHLENNQLTGQIPESFGILPRLREIFLQGNNLTGSIPENLQNRTDIKLRVSPGNDLLVKHNVKKARKKPED